MPSRDANSSPACERTTTKPRFAGGKTRVESSTRDRAMPSSLFRIAAFGLVLVALAGTRTTRAAELSAGAARIDITPPLEYGSPLGGYGERMSRPAEGVHDRVFAKALVLSDGQQRFALVTIDIVGLSPAIKPAVLDRLASDSWSAGQIMLLPSHSHTSIEMNAVNPANTFDIPQIGIHNPRVYDFLVDRLAEVIRDAGRGLVPVRIGTSQTQITGWNRNRRNSPELDQDLTVTRVDRLDGRPLAVFVNFTAHPTFMSGKDMLFSGDWPGHLQRTLEALIGNDVVAMYSNGAEGDQSVIARPDSGDSRYEKAERYGRELGVVAFRQWEQTAVQSDVLFGYRTHPIKLPERTWHPDFKQTGGAEYGLTEDLLREMLPRLFPPEVDTVSLRVGDLLVIGVPGEMTARLGLEIKHRARAASGAAAPVIGGLADVWLSYILPPDEYRKGGYEASVSFYGETLGPTIVEGVLEGVGSN